MMEVVKTAVYDGLVDIVGFRQTYKLGLDYHGVIDADPEFVKLANYLMEHGSEVHILTGSRETVELHDQLKALGIKYTRLFSVASHHEALGTHMWYTDPQNPWMDAEVWNRSKADYCREHGINLMVDDSDVYGQYFTTPYIRYRKKS